MSFVPLTATLIANGLLDWFPIIACVVLGALGALLVLVSVGFFFQTLWLLCCGDRVIATFLGYRNEQEEFKFHDEDPVGHVRRESIPVTFHVPVFTFDDENGQRQEVEGMGTIKKHFQQGDEVALIYSPGNPNRCVVDAFANRWVPAVSAFFIGVILAAFPAYMILKWVTD